jgi:hypothetical protein
MWPAQPTADHFHGMQQRVGACRIGEGPLRYFVMAEAFEKTQGSLVVIGRACQSRCGIRGVFAGLRRARARFFSLPVSHAFANTSEEE